MTAFLLHSLLRRVVSHRQLSLQGKSSFVFAPFAAQSQRPFCFFLFLRSSFTSFPLSVFYPETCFSIFPPKLFCPCLLIAFLLPEIIRGISQRDNESLVSLTSIPPFKLWAYSRFRFLSLGKSHTFNFLYRSVCVSLPTHHPGLICSCFATFLKLRSGVKKVTASNLMI